MLQQNDTNVGVVWFDRNDWYAMCRLQIGQETAESHMEITFCDWKYCIRTLYPIWPNLVSAQSLLNFARKLKEPFQGHYANYKWKQILSTCNVDSFIIKKIRWQFTQELQIKEED